jgi:hypothetical protein
MSDAALGQDQFQPVNRRAGYGDALEMALSAARKGWTLSAGQGLLIIEHYEEKLAAVRVVESSEKSASDAPPEMNHMEASAWACGHDASRAALTAALAQEDA